MKTTLIATLACAWIVAACSSGAGDPGADAAASASITDGGTQASRIDTLATAGVPMPDATTGTLDAATVAASTKAAAAQPGTREPFQSFHDTVSPMRPISNLRLASLAPVEVCLTTDPGGAGTSTCTTPPTVPPVDPVACPRVCSTACASATATAAAAAFAHASVQACAFAQAWACVFDSVAPFDRVCAWASSRACVSAFASAFGVGFAVSNDQRCRTVCSDGTVTVTEGPQPVAAGQ